MDVEQFLIGERPGQRVVARDASHRFESVVSVVLRCDWIVAQRVLLGSRCGVALPVLIPGGRFEELPGVAHNLWVTDRAVTPRQIREVLKSAQGSTSCGNAASNLANQP